MCLGERGKRRDDNGGEEERREEKGEGAEKAEGEGRREG